MTIMKTVGINREHLLQPFVDQLMGGDIKVPSQDGVWYTAFFSVLNEGMGILWVTGAKKDVCNLVRGHKLTAIYWSSDREVVV